MGRILAGELFAKALKREGVRYIFTLCGRHSAPVYLGCEKEGITVVDVRHEEVAAHAAAGWSRATGEVGVAVVTAGPGVSNSLNGISGAFQTFCPMVEFGGRIPLAEFEMETGQDMDQVRVLEPTTKWARTIWEPRRIPEYVATAFRKAKASPPGPVFLDCPIDLLIQDVDEEDVVWSTNDFGGWTPPGDPAVVSRAVELLRQAERPMVIAGDEIRWTNAAQELLEFVELMEIPVRMTDAARGAVPEDHPLAIGAHAGPLADVVLTLGARITARLGFGRSPFFDPKAKFIQVNLDATAIGLNRNADVGILGSSKGVLRQMIEEVKTFKKKVDRTAWLSQVQSAASQYRKEASRHYDASTLPIHPGRLVREVTEFMDRDAVAVVDGGDSGGWFRGYFKARSMWNLIPTNGLGSGTGTAIAAKLAYPDRQVVLFGGDGSFGLAGMEFDTMVRFDLPVVGVISNDNGWGMIRSGQKIRHGGSTTAANLRSSQRYDQMVAALGGYGELVERIEDIKPALARAFASGKPSLINVLVDPDPVSPATMEFWKVMGMLKSYEQKEC